MMKKMFKALLATGLAVSLLGACGNAKKQEGQKESKQVETSADAEKKTDGEKNYSYGCPLSEQRILWIKRCGRRFWRPLRRKTIVMLQLK